MSAESEALMQQFRQAVYERLVNPGTGSQLSPEGSIEQRSIAFRDWLLTTQNAKESVELAPDFVRHWAVADITSWREMPDDRQDLAANDIFQNLSAYVSYAEILQTIDAEMVDRVKQLSAESDRKAAEKEARKAREAGDTRATLLAEQQVALRVAESFKDAGHVPDDEWIQLGRAVDRVYLGGDRADLGAALELATTMARVDTSRPCPFPESPVQRAFESERTYQASRASANHEEVVDDLALRAGNEGDPAPHYVLESRRAIEHYAFGLELRLEALRATDADALALRDVQELLAVAHERAKALSDNGSETTHTERAEAPREEVTAQKKYYAAQAQTRVARATAKNSDSQAAHIMDSALREICDWPENGNRYGPSKLKTFAKEKLDDARRFGLTRVEMAEATRIMHSALTEICTWPDGGNRGGQGDIKTFAQEKLDEARRLTIKHVAPGQAASALESASAPGMVSEPRATEEADGFAGEAKGGDADEKPFDPELAISKVLENVTYKSQNDGSVLYMVSERPAFIDHGQQIVMANKANEDEEAILAAVLLAKEKFGGAFELTGSEAFQRRAIEVMLKHKVDVTLKNPQQDALRRELAKGGGDAPKGPEAQEGTGPKPLIGKPANGDQDADSSPVKASPSNVPDEVSAGGLAADLIPVRALDWWSVQREAIQVWAKSDDELKADLEQLGPQPSSDLIYWFDKAGKPCDPPADADRYLANLKSEPAGFTSGSESELRMRDAMGNGEVSAKSSNSEVTAMSDNQASKENEPKLILRGVRKLDNGEFDTTALLFKGNGDYLQGFIKVGDEKHQVIAHMNERKNPDPETGEIKPNFLKLVEPHGNGDDTNWKELGFGNAVNRRSDGKPVYFDEVLFSVGNEVIKARITKNVDDELHRKLGFQEARQARPRDDSKSSAAPGEASPKPTAPAAKPKEDAAGAPKARRSSRAKA